MFLFSKVAKEDFPGGPMVKNLPVNAGDTVLILGLGRSHILWGNKASVPLLLKPTYSRACALQPEAITLRSLRIAIREKPLLAVTGESPRAAIKTRHSQ